MKIILNRNILQRCGNRCYFNHKLFYHLIWNHFNPNNIVKKGYDIHHIDGNSLNDHISNLELLTHEQHTSIHKIGNLFWVDKKHSDESKNKISINRKGKYSGKHNPMYGVRLVGETNGFFGKKHTKESLQKMSESHKKHKPTTEHKKKISESNKLRWAERKLRENSTSAT